MTTPAHSSRAAAPRSTTSGSSDTMVGSFRRMNQIGKGSFATVYKGVHMDRRELTVAIKSVDTSKLNRKLKDNLSTEIRILRNLTHPHIVALIDCQEMPQYIHIVTEFCELGDLSHFIKKRATLADHPAAAHMMTKYPNPPVGGLNEVLCRHFLKQIASALEFMHSKNYVHRDLKPQNLLLNPSPLYYQTHRPSEIPYAAATDSMVPTVGIASLPMLKVADFGFARWLPKSSLAETLCGSPLYMAPEILRYEKYDAKADLWSTGAVVFEMLVGKPPFSASNHVELLRRIEKNKDTILFGEVPISRDMKNIVRDLLKQSPLDRIQHEKFFSDVVITGEIPGVHREDAPHDAVDACSRPSPDGHLPRNSALAKTPSSRLPSGTTPPRQPSTIAAPSSSNRPIRRPSNAATSPRDRPSSHQSERRPTVTHTATAPAGAPATQARPTAAAMAVGRQSGGHSFSPSSSALRDHFQRERNPQKPDERSVREVKERAAQDVAFERDYVVVEKRSVEVNAFADEMAASPQLTREYIRRDGAMVRRATTQCAPQGNSARATQAAPSTRRPDPVQQRKSSHETPYATSPGSAASAISKALNMASYRIFGTGPSPPKGYAQFSMCPTPQSGMLVVAEAQPAMGEKTKDKNVRVLEMVEELAEQSHVVYGFAEVKYKQLLPPPPSDKGPGATPGDHIPSEVDGADDNDDSLDEDLTVDAFLLIAEEALVLYVKTLALLARSFDLAGSWWSQRSRGENLSDPGVSHNHTSNSTGAAVHMRMNHAVQWGRTRFNECVDKSGFVGRKLVDAQRQLPVDHHAHPSNLPSNSTSTTSTGASVENIHLPNGITAEKLMYDRAVEMCRAAAIDEILNEKLDGCQVSYATAIRMLQAIYEGDEELLACRSGGQRQDADANPGLSDDADDDRESVLKLIEETKQRHKRVCAKMERQRSQKQSSLPAGRGSKRATPAVSNAPPR